MPTITQIKYALAVYELRHFGKAAKRLPCQSANVSMQLQKLEDEMETILFDRSKMPVRPTQRGSRFCSRCAP